MPREVNAVCFFDVDGTMVTRAIESGSVEEAPSQRVCDAIRAFVAAGNVAFLSTGRGPDGINRHLRELPFSGMVCVDGAYVEHDGKPILDAFFPKELADAYLTQCLELGVPTALNCRGGSIAVGGRAFGFSGDILEASSVEEAYEAMGGDLHAWKANVSTEGLERLVRSSNVMDRFEHYDAGIGAQELTLLGVGKGAGAKRLLESAGVVPKHVMCFGDSGNDVPIFDICDISVCLGNGDDEAKEHATYVTEDLAHDGVAVGLESLRQFWE